MTYEYRANPRRVTGLLPSMSYLLLASNSIGAIFRAYSSGKNWFLAFIFFIYSSFFLLEYCFSAYHQLPNHQKSTRKNFLGVVIWCLFTGIIFGFTYQLAVYFSFALAMPLYAVALTGSAIIFYAYIIHDYSGKCDGNCCDSNTTTHSTHSDFRVSGGYVEIIFEKV